MAFQGSAHRFANAPDDVDSPPIAATPLDNSPFSFTKIVAVAIYSPPIWALIIGVACVDFMLLGRSRLSFGGWRDVAWIVLFMWSLGVYGAFRNIPKLADAGHHAAMWVAFLAVNMVFTYLCATMRMPLHDVAFARINDALGFEWSRWFLAIMAHPVPRTILSDAYSSLLFQIFGSIIYLAISGRGARNHQLLWAVMLSALISAVVSGLLPAIGPFVPGQMPNFSVALLGVRSGAVSHIDVIDMKGIVTMPSFHTVLAILFTWAHRPPSRSFIPVALLNLVMLISIPFAGHHYVVDMLAGAALAAVTIAMVTAMTPRPSPSVTVARAIEA